MTEDCKLTLDDNSVDLTITSCHMINLWKNVESVFINPDTKEHKSCGIEVFDATSLLMIRDGLGEFKPYLFPLSSMTDEQKRAYNMMSLDADWVSNPHYSVPAYNVLDWLDENYLDYRDLIGKGLAIDATGLGIY